MSNAERALTDELRNLAKEIRDCDVEGHAMSAFGLAPGLCLFCGARLEIEVRK